MTGIRFSSGLALALAIVLAAGVSSARTLTWQGESGGNWSVAANWLDGDETASAAPTDGDILKFANTSTMTANNDMTGLTVGGFILSNTAALTITGNSFSHAGEITMNQPSANVSDIFYPDIELTGDLVIRFRYGSGNKSHQITFNGVLSGTGGLAVDTSNSSGESKIVLNAVNTFTGSVCYTGNGGYVQTYFKTIANAGEPSSFGAGTDGVIIGGRLYAKGTGGTTDRPWKILQCAGFDLSNTNPLVYAGTFDCNGVDIGYTGGGTLKFLGQVLRLGKISSTNGNNIYFDSADNTAASAKDVVLQNATFYVKKFADSGAQSSIGSGSLIRLGQAYNTPSALVYTGTEDASCNRTLDVICSSSASTVHHVTVTNAGTTLEFSGDVTDSTSTTPVLTPGGAGNLRTSGTLTGRYSVNKTGTGVWTHSGTATYTGSTTVSAGSFVLDGTLASSVTVKSGATLSGTGTAGGAVTLNGGAILSVADKAQPLAVTGALTISGDITVAVPSDWDGSALTAVTYGSVSRVGKVTVSGVSFEVQTTFDDDRLVLSVGGAVKARTWTGAVNATWDTTTANWADALLFSAGCEPTFPAGAANRDIAIPESVKVGAMTVTGDDDYSFSGAAITGNAAFAKTGAGVATFANATRFSGMDISGGEVKVASGGVLENSIVAIASGATLTVEPGGSIDGTGSLTVRGTYTGRSTTSSYTGETHLYASTTAYNDRTFGAPETGCVTFEQNDVRLSFAEDCYLRKRLHKDNSAIYLTTPAVGTAGLYGDFSHSSGTGPIVVEDPSGARDAALVLGEPDGTNRFYNSSTSAGDAYGITLKVRLIRDGRNHVDLNARFRYQTAGKIEVHNGGQIHYLQVNSTNNQWAVTEIREGLLRVGADEALAHGAETYAIAAESSSWACLDLRGHRQTLSTFRDRESDSAAMNGAFVIRSTDGVGTLVLDGTCRLIRPRTRLTGELNVVKTGTGACEFGFGSADAASDQTGFVSVGGGTFSATAAGVFGAATNIAVAADATLSCGVTDTLGAARTCSLDLASGATLAIPEGVSVTVAYARLGKAGGEWSSLGRGTYDASTCSAISGAGRLVVARGRNGIAAILR